MAPETAFERTIRRLGETNLVALFGHRVARTTIANWRAGRRNVPPWAIDLLRNKIRAAHESELADLSQVKAGPGLRAGAKNLAAYLARR